MGYGLDRSSQPVGARVRRPASAGATLTLGGAWSTYWYNGFMYESEITKGLNVFGLNDPRANAAVEFPFLNPQTQMQTISQDVVASSVVTLSHSNVAASLLGDGRIVRGRMCGRSPDHRLQAIRERRPPQCRLNDGKRRRWVPSTPHRWRRGQLLRCSSRQNRYDGVNTTECLRAQSPTRNVSR